jgi:enoyl-CoA hydratase/carnithine racemase
MSDDVLLCDTTDAVARLTLNRPKAMNSLNLAMVAALNQRLVELAAHDSVRVVVLTGSGSAFCAGADLKEILASQNLPAGEPDFLDRATAG